MVDTSASLMEGFLPFLLLLVDRTFHFFLVHRILCPISSTYLSDVSHILRDFACTYT